MSGLICHQIVVAILPGDGIPSNAVEFPVFDHKMRQIFATPYIAQSIGEAGQSMAAITILEKPEWSLSDRTTLYNIIESLYGG